MKKLIEPPHETENGWCCACEADIAFLNGRIEDAIQQERSRLLEEIEGIEKEKKAVLQEAGLGNVPILIDVEEIKRILK